VESTQSRIESFQETIQRIKEDKEITDSVRNVRINMATEQLEKVKSQMMVLDQFRIAAIKHCLPLVGQGGSITIWAPAKLAPRSQQLIAGEPIVINVQLNKVVEGANVTTPVLPKKLPLKPMPGKVSTQPQNNTDKKAMPRTIVPVQPAKQPAPQKK
jgi:histidine ammonia-lyase